MVSLNRLVRASTVVAIFIHLVSHNLDICSFNTFIVALDGISQL